MAEGCFKTWICGIIMLAWLLVACNTAESPTRAPEAESVEPAPTLLSIYNWDTYIDPEILSDFEQEKRIVIDYQVFDTDDDMLVELQAGGTDYDLVVPSDVTVSEMRNDRLLAPLDKDRIPNFKNVHPAFINPVFDPANRYCAPYQWGTVGIGYNVNAIGKEVKGWSDFFDPEYAGRVALLDDYRTTLGIALLLHGNSPNTTDLDEIAQATEFLKSHSEQIGAYAGDDAQDRLVAGEYDMVMEWSGDVFQVMEDDPNIRYVIPAEGSIIWTDNICIPAEAPNKELAEDFIDYILDPEVGAKLSNYVQYGSPNEASLPFINEEDLSNPAIYPPDDVLERLFFLVDVEMAADNAYREAWREVVSEHES